MSTDDNSRMWISAGAVGALACTVVIFALSPLNPDIVPQALLTVAILGIVPFLFRALWPLLARVSFLSPGLVLLAILTAAGACACVVVMLASRQWWMIPVVVTGVGVAAVAIRHEYLAYTMFRRRILHLCPTCGYDLRASVKQCPECGTEIPEGYTYHLTRDFSAPKPEPRHAGSAAGAKVGGDDKAAGKR